jgi:hypothetical protein
MYYIDKEDTAWKIDIVDKQLCDAIFFNGADMEASIELALGLKAIMMYAI